MRPSFPDGDPITEGHIVEALENSGGQDRPVLEQVTWDDDVVLPERTQEDLRTLIRLMEPGAAERLSLPAPTGLILLGAPGVGKTLTARLIASQSKRSFFAITPSILFFDEMDGLLPTVHGPVGQHDVHLVEQTLIEMSALKPEHNVFLVGTTNYPDRVDLIKDASYYWVLLVGSGQTRRLFGTIAGRIAALPVAPG